MKRILITGKESYIGTAVEKWLSQPRFIEKYKVDTMDMRSGDWKKKKFSGYDAILHVAGIVHQRETRRNIYLYDKVNRELAIQTAKKARKEGVGQFVLLSSMSVYGMLDGTITRETIPHPTTNYGRTKLEADREIEKLSTPNFNVSIIRPPMVYGKDCKGNYQLLRKAALLCPVFPKIKNKKSMIYINNLTEYIRVVIDKEQSGIFFPQNPEYASTCEMVKQIAETHNKKVLFVEIFNPIINRVYFPIVKKVFGNLTYSFESQQMCEMVHFTESIRLTESE